MDKQEALETEYLIKKRQFEAKEADILFRRDQGIHDLETVAEMTHDCLKDYVPDQAFITQAVHKLDRMKEELYEAAQQDRKLLEEEIEELDESYYRGIRTLFDKESAKKESEF